MNWKTFRQRIEEEHDELHDVLPDIQFRKAQLEYLAQNAKRLPGDTEHYLKEAIKLLGTSQMAFDEAMTYVKGILDDYDERGNYKP